MDEPIYLIEGHRVPAGSSALQSVLGSAYGGQSRPMCLCVPGGVEMYIAKHRNFVVKRMPGTGPRHHPSCESFEPDAGSSGLGALMGSAIAPSADHILDVKVSFPLARAGGRTAPVKPGQEKLDVNRSASRVSLHGLLQFLFEQAGFNRWSPAMAGRRHQAVIQKYLNEAASEIRVKGTLLSERLYVPEAFDEAAKLDIIARRRERLSMLRAATDGAYEMALVIGEFKDAVIGPGGVSIRIRHMADARLNMETKTWERLQRKFSWLFELSASEVGDHVKIILCMLVYANQEHVLKVDTATCMLTTRNWIPIDASFEIDLAARLTDEERRFLKPLRYDAAPSEPFPNYLLLDTGTAPTPLHILSGFMSKEARKAKERMIAEAGSSAWVWRTNEPIPALPPRVAREAASSSRD